MHILQTVQMSPNFKLFKRSNKVNKRAILSMEWILLEIQMPYTYS